VKLIAFIAEPTVAKRILDHLGLDSTGPPLAPPRVETATARFRSRGDRLSRMFRAGCFA
jgi:hypothetical protein